MENKERVRLLRLFCTKQDQAANDIGIGVVYLNQIINGHAEPGEAKANRIDKWLEGRIKEVSK